MNKRELILERYPEDEFMILPEEFDDAIIGMAERCGSNPVLAYDRDKVIEVYISEGMSEEEAIEYFEYNTIGSYVGEGTPVFVCVPNSMW